MVRHELKKRGRSVELKDYRVRLPERFQYGHRYDHVGAFPECWSAEVAGPIANLAISMMVARLSN